MQFKDFSRTKYNSRTFQEQMQFKDFARPCQPSEALLTTYFNDNLLAMLMIYQFNSQQPTLFSQDFQKAYLFILDL